MKLTKYLFGRCADPLCRRYGHRPDMFCATGGHHLVTRRAAKAHARGAGWQKPVKPPKGPPPRGLPPRP